MAHVTYDDAAARLILNEAEEPYLRDIASRVAMRGRLLGASSIRTGALEASIHVVMLHGHGGMPVAQVWSLGYGIFLDDTFNQRSEQMTENHPLLVQALADELDVEI